MIMVECYLDLFFEFVRWVVFLMLGCYLDLCFYGVCFIEFLFFKFLFKGYFGFSIVCNFFFSVYWCMFNVKSFDWMYNKVVLKNFMWVYYVMILVCLMVECWLILKRVKSWNGVKKKKF